MKPSHKRRALNSSHGPDEPKWHETLFATPVQQQQQPGLLSASTSRLHKRNSAGRSVASAGTMRVGSSGLPTTPEAGVNTWEQEQGMQEPNRREPSLHVRKSFQSLGKNSLLLENPDTENKRPSWLHRKSTLSSLKSGSPANTDRPDSMSLSFSNRSTTPILPDHSKASPTPAQRNKLVKRSSSQRALQTDASPYSSLRRPATSHQRSATLQRQFGFEEGSQRPTSSLGISDQNASEPLEPLDESSQTWRPFFRSQASWASKIGSVRKRTIRGARGKEESIRSVVPDINEVPTLLLATSISTRSSVEATGRSSNVSALSRPFTPIGLRDTSTPNQPGSYLGEPETEPKPRTSFSLSEMFPSPSPLSWKMPRTGSVNHKKNWERSGDGRRISSAPQTSRTRKMATPSRRPGAAAANQRRPQREAGGHQSVKSSDDERPPSSPLPPLNRLSTFELSLPATIPSYPTSPQAEDSHTPFRNFSSRSSPSFPYQMRQTFSRDPSHRPSGAPSDHTSTLLGSDNEISRVFSADGEDLDARSDTVYDSTRTGATGKSVGGVKRPPIDTIFDESLSAGIPREVELHRSEATKGTTEINIPPVAHVEKVRGETPPPVPPKDKSPAGRYSLLQSPSFAMPVGSSDIAAKTADGTTVQIEPISPWILKEDESLANRSEPSRETHRSRLEANKAQSSNKSTPRRRQSPPNTSQDRTSKAHLFEWSEPTDVEQSPGASPRPKTVDGRQVIDARSGRFSNRKGPSALHLRSQSVPVPDEHRAHNNASKLDSWVLGNKGPSEDWDGDFEFDEPSQADEDIPNGSGPMHMSLSSGMLVPRAILDRQASVHGQFGQVKELTLLVEELKRLQQRAHSLNIMGGQASELWKEAEGIIELATIDDDERDPFSPRSPHSPGPFDLDAFDEDSPLSRRRRSGFSPPKEDAHSASEDANSARSSRPSQDLGKLETPPPPSSRVRKDSTAKAKSVMETIHHQRNQQGSPLLDVKPSQAKLPFDTTSLKDLVTRAGVVTRALKELVRRAEGGPVTPPANPATPKDHSLSQLFHQPPPSPITSPSPTMMRNHNSTTQNQSPKGAARSPKSPKSNKSNAALFGATISAGNDNEINGHMKIMTVV